MPTLTVPALQIHVPVASVTITCGIGGAGKDYCTVAIASQDIQLAVMVFTLIHSQIIAFNTFHLNARISLVFI